MAKKEIKFEKLGNPFEVGRLKGITHEEARDILGNPSALSGKSVLERFRLMAEVAAHLSRCAECREMALRMFRGK